VISSWVGCAFWRERGEGTLIAGTIARIRREHRDEKSIKEVARELNLSRNTFRRAGGHTNRYAGVPGSAPFQRAMPICLGLISHSNFLRVECVADLRHRAPVRLVRIPIFCAWSVSQICDIGRQLDLWPALTQLAFWIVVSRAKDPGLRPNLRQKGKGSGTGRPEILRLNQVKEEGVLWKRKRIKGKAL
jgi:hypothetical protein